MSYNLDHRVFVALALLSLLALRNLALAVASSVPVLNSRRAVADVLLLYAARRLLSASLFRLLNRRSRPVPFTTYRLLFL